jgi:hypothetical protein
LWGKSKINKNIKKKKKKNIASLWLNGQLVPVFFSI